MTWHLRPASASRGWSSSSRCRSCLGMSRFFAVTASTTAFRRSTWTTQDDPRWLQTPCTVRLGEPNRKAAMSDALCRPAVLSRELHLSRSPPSTFHLSTDAPGFPPRQSQSPYYRVRAIRTFDPGRLPPARCSTLRLSEADSRSLTVRAHSASEHPFIRRSQTHRRQDGNCRSALPYPT
jgi:hypothetical protein